VPRSAEQLVELGDQRGQEPAVRTVEQARDGAQQVAHQLPVTGQPRDVEVDGRQVDDQPEQVEVQGPQVEVQDVARLWEGDAQVLALDALGDGRAVGRADEGAGAQQPPAFRGDLGDGQRAVKSPPSASVPVTGMLLSGLSSGAASAVPTGATKPSPSAFPSHQCR
jgi:hypothetical protein